MGADPTWAIYGTLGVIALMVLLMVPAIADQKRAEDQLKAMERQLLQARYNVERSLLDLEQHAGGHRPKQRSLRNSPSAHLGSSSSEARDCCGYAGPPEGCITSGCPHQDPAPVYPYEPDFDLIDFVGVSPKRAAKERAKMKAEHERSKVDQAMAEERALAMAAAWEEIAAIEAAAGLGTGVAGASDGGLDRRPTGSIPARSTEEGFPLATERLRW